MTREWLATGMFASDPQATTKINRVMQELADHAITKSHARHISLKAAQNLGLVVTPLEADQALQDAVLSVHHACILTLNATPAIKIVENDQGIAFIQAMQQQIMVR
jgi:hypothetical protein